MTPDNGSSADVPTLLIGGTKHGQTLNLPEGQDEYELVEANVLAGVGYGVNDKRYVPSLYLLDETLTRLLDRQVFIHRTFKVKNFATLDRDLADALEEQKRLGDRVIELSIDVSEALELLDSVENDLEHSHAENDKLANTILGARQQLEVAAIANGMIHLILGVDYPAAFVDRPESA